MLSLLHAVNDISQKVEGDDTSDNEGCGRNLHAGCPSVHVMRRAKRHFGASLVHSQYTTTSLVNRSRRESVNLFAVQQPFTSTLEWGTTVEGIEGVAVRGEMKSCGEFKISLHGCVIDLIAKLTAMYMELGAVATRDSNLQLVTVCQIAQELIYVLPDRTGDFSFGLFQWLCERQPNARMGDLPNAQGVCATVFEFIHLISLCCCSWLVCHATVTTSSSLLFLLMI